MFTLLSCFCLRLQPTTVWQLVDAIGKVLAGCKPRHPSTPAARAINEIPFSMDLRQQYSSTSLGQRFWQLFRDRLALESPWSSIPWSPIMPWLHICCRLELETQPLDFEFRQFFLPSDHR